MFVSDLLKGDRNNATAMYVKAMSYYYQDVEDRAMQFFTQALRVDPDHTKARLALKVSSNYALMLWIELGDILVLSLHCDKNPTSRSDISIAFARYYRFLRKPFVRVVKLMRELHAHDS